MVTYYNNMGTLQFDFATWYDEIETLYYKMVTRYNKMATRFLIIDIFKTGLEFCMEVERHEKQLKKSKGCRFNIQISRSDDCGDYGSSFVFAGAHVRIECGFAETYSGYDFARST